MYICWQHLSQQTHSKNPHQLSHPHQLSSYSGLHLGRVCIDWLYSWFHHTTSMQPMSNLILTHYKTLFLAWQFIMPNRMKSKQSQKSFERCAFLWICSSSFSWISNSYSYLDMNYILHTLDKAATVFVQTIYSDIVDNYLWFIKYMSYNTCTQSEPSLFSSGHSTVLFSHTHTISTLKHAKTHNKHT